MKNILVPISFSETSKNALVNASQIAKESGATLHLLHCYAEQEYNRKYDFGGDDYAEGIENMLIDFYASTGDQQAYELLTYTGPVSDTISKISHNFDLLVLSRKTGFLASSNKWFSDKIMYFTSRSACPVLLLSSQKTIGSFADMKEIWHLNRKDKEEKLITRELRAMKIDPQSVVSKSLQQVSFASAFWKNIVKYSKTHDDKLLPKITECYTDEHIDLVILVNHKKGIFERFIKDDIFQIISQFDIPILVLQA